MRRLYPPPPEPLTLDFGRIGRQIRAVRQESGLTQAQLTERAGLSVPYLSHVERGTKRVSLSALIAIANALCVTADRLLTGSQPADATAYFPEVQALLADCTLRERALVSDVARAAKESLRNNFPAA
ncbi:MAG: helix-turn-helix transcriptional regulator [Oscillospiraceae bacterium]